MLMEARRECLIAGTGVTVFSHLSTGWETLCWAQVYIFLKFIFCLIVLVITFERRNEKENFRSGFEVIKIV